MNAIKRGLNIGLLLTSFLGYLEWGNNHTFLLQVEYDIIFSKHKDAETFMHPFILVPLLGQLMLLITIFQKNPYRILTITGLICLSTIMVFLFAIGLISKNIRITLAALPFIVTGMLVLRYNKKQRMSR